MPVTRHKDQHLLGVVGAQTLLFIDVVAQPHDGKNRRILGILFGIQTVLGGNTPKPAAEIAGQNIIQAFEQSVTLGHLPCGKTKQAAARLGADQKDV